MKVKIIVVILLCIILYSCGTKISPQQQTEKGLVVVPENKIVKEDIPENTQTAQLPNFMMLSPEQAEGKDLYDNNCAKCHKLYNPKDFNSEQWKPILEVMQKNAGLTDEQRIKVYTYLTSN